MRTKVTNGALWIQTKPGCENFFKKNFMASFIDGVQLPQG